MTKRKRSKKWIYWVVVLVLLVVAGFVGYKVWEGYFKDIPKPNESSEEETSEKSEDKESEKTKGETEEKKQEETPKEEEPEKKVEQYDGENPNTGGGLTGVITYAAVSGDNLIIRVNIDQYLASGDCQLKLLRGDSVIYNSTAEITDSAATSTCKGFNVPVANLGSGKANINILLIADGKTGIIKGEVNI